MVFWASALQGRGLVEMGHTWVQAFGGSEWKDPAPSTGTACQVDTTQAMNTSERKRTRTWTARASTCTNMRVLSHTRAFTQACMFSHTSAHSHRHTCPLTSQHIQKDILAGEHFRDRHHGVFFCVYTRTFKCIIIKQHVCVCVCARACVCSCFISAIFACPTALPIWIVVCVEERCGACLTAQQRRVP